MEKTLAIASDHAGFALKEILKPEAKKLGYNVLDLGTNSTESVDYPDFGSMLAENVASGKAQFGVAICGSGIGISIAANRNPNIRAALCHNAETAILSRQHNDANILALGARIVDEQTAKDCLKAFLNTEFEGGRHQRRIDKLSTRK
jgi:ribose 5-phosphate isomerase B